MADEPPSPLPRGLIADPSVEAGLRHGLERPLLTLPEIIRIIAPGVVTTQLSSVPPASSSATDVRGSSERRLATVQPPEPPPTTTKSNVSFTAHPPNVCNRSGTVYGPLGPEFFSGRVLMLCHFVAQC